MEAIKTSLKANKNQEFLRVPYYTWKRTGGGFIVGGFLASIVWSIPLLPGLIMVVVPIVTFILAQKAITGNYEFEGWERFCGKIRALFSVPVVELENELRFEESTGSDLALYGKNGFEIECYEIIDSDVRSILADYRYLLRNLPDGDRCHFVRLSFPITTKRKCLAKAQKLSCYVIFEYQVSAITRGIFKKEVKKTLGSKRGRLLSKTETLAVMRALSHLQLKDHEFEKPMKFRDIAIDIEKELLNFGEVEGRAALFSLAVLPEKVGPQLQKIFDLFNGSSGCLAVSFSALGAKSLLYEVFEHRRRESLKNQEDETGLGAVVNLGMTMIALIHGKEEEITDLTEDLKREFSYLDEAERPYFKRESHFIKEAILTMTPGCSVMIPRRMMNIARLEECLRYIPLPVSSGASKPFLPLRTESNSLYNFGLYPSYPLYVWAGVGKGKSALLSLLLLTHMKKDGSASFAMEAGGTFAFLRDGLSDVNIILEQNVDGRWLALEDHPLRLFFAFGESGIEAATEWLMGLASVDDFTGDVKTAVRGTLRRAQNDNIYRLKDLFVLLDETLKSTQIDQRICTSTLTNIGNFAALNESQYGHIFDPEVTKKIDYTAARHFYVSQIEATKEAPTLLKAFFSYGIYVLKAVEKRFSASGSAPAEMIVALDEINHLIKEHYISWNDLRDLNSQGRKQGKLICCASQSLADAIAPGSDRAYEFVESFGHFLFASGVSDTNHIVKALRISDDAKAEVVKKEFQRMIDTIDTIRRRGKGYAWGYIDPEGEFRIIIFDLEKAEQWAVTSHKEARILRQETIRSGNLSYSRACDLLALYGPGELPVNDKPSQEWKLAAFEKMWRHSDAD